MASVSFFYPCLIFSSCTQKSSRLITNAHGILVRSPMSFCTLRLSISSILYRALFRVFAMSSRGSPSFPKLRSKLTPETESGFFRNWSLRPSARLSRSSDTGQSSDVSPGTSPTPLPTYPGSGKAQRRIARPQNHRLRSDPVSKSIISQGVEHDDFPSAPTTTGMADRKPSLLDKPSIESLASGLRKSSSSPGSSTFRRLVQFSSQCLAPSAVTQASASVKARDDIQWKHEISGRSVEIRIVRKPPMEGMNKGVEDTAPPDRAMHPSSEVAIPKSLPLKPVKQNDLLHDRLIPPGSTGPLAIGTQGSAKSAPATPAPKAGKTFLKKYRSGPKQVLLNQQRPESSQTRSMTGHLLERAASILKDFAEKKTSPTSGATSSSSDNISIAASYSRYLRHQRLTPFYKGYSNSNSLGNMNASKAPLATPASPDSRLMYLGSDDRQYFRVEISEPGAPTYLPSEARRIGTPPLPDQSGRVRGFFFNYNAPDDEIDTPSPEKFENSSLQPQIRRKRTPDFDWYRAKLVADEERDLMTNFELNVPDHLPGSPLCPKHPKHKSGGRGICVYHGRNRELELNAET